MEAAQVAALIHREASRRGGGQWVHEKTTSSDFVSDVDMAAQEAAMAVIATRHPHHAILAEEDGGGRDGALGTEYIWLVDPLDGTTNFLHGTGFPFKAHDVMDPYLRELDRALRHTSGVRRTGAAAIDLAYVANGILDGFWETRLAPWDFGAGILFVTEAGGVVERIEGGPVDTAAGSVIAANSADGLEGLRGVIRPAPPAR